MKGAQNESESGTGFPGCVDMARRPTRESADSLINISRPTINTHDFNCSNYLTDDLQTLVSKRMSYLLRHGAATEAVAMSSQGYVKLADLIKWQYQDIMVHVCMSDITRIVQQDRKAMYKILNGQICAVNGHSLDLPLMTFPVYNEGIGGHPRYLVHETYFKCLPAILKQGLSRIKAW